jgi:hypothetical protein
MTDPVGRSNSTRDETAPEPGRRSTEETPRWVKVFGIVALVVVVVFVFLLVAGGPHGPSRHLATGMSQPALGDA